MLALGIDTSSSAGSVGVANDTGLLAELNLRSATTHSSRLLPAVRSLLATAGLVPAQVDLLAVATGPGSFTGIRIGMATAKGLGLALECPLTGFSTLETMALAGAPATAGGGAANICILLDAARREVYRGLFRCEGSSVAALAPEAALPPGEAAAGLPADCILYGDGLETYAEILRPLLPPGAVLAGDAPFIGLTLARRALEEAARQGLDRLSPPIPNYLRLSDAERPSKRP